MTEANAELLEIFKALADANRLKIIGLLARQPYSVEQLAALLNLKPPTVSHHLSKLSEVGLVGAKAEGYYSMYYLDESALKKTRLLFSQLDLSELCRRRGSGCLRPQGGQGLLTPERPAENPAGAAQEAGCDSALCGQVVRTGETLQRKGGQRYPRAIPRRHRVPAAGIGRKRVDAARRRRGRLLESRDPSRHFMTPSQNPFWIWGGVGFIRTSTEFADLGKSFSRQA